MNRDDEARIKILTILRQEGGRGVPATDFTDSKRHVRLLFEMKSDGWIGVSKGRTIKLVWITMKGRQVLKSFERIYR